MTMKIITIIFLINLIFSSDVYTQPNGWLFVDSNTKDGFERVYFLNKNEGWAVGRTIIFTRDGGNTWYKQFEGIKEKYTIFFRSICFVDQNSGWVVGDQGVILRTSNGGLTWTRKISNIEPFDIIGVKLPVTLFSVQFVNQNTGWAVGEYGTIIHTSNGGVIWGKQKSGTTHHLNRLFFLDEKNGWVVGNKGIILHTNSGGESWFKPWKKQNSGIDVPIWSIYFIDNENGWAVAGRNIILHTTDGGKTWTKQKPNVDKSLRDVFFLDKDNGWIVGYEVILHTQDGGKTWIVYPSGTRYGLVSLYFVDRNHGWAVGEHGTILRYVGENGPSR
jgi:photosystem II stability/assembly factor-like uncharacterized protein